MANHRLRIVSKEDDIEHAYDTQTVAGEQRSLERFAVQSKPVQIRTTMDAQLVDESCDGVGLILESAVGLSVGQHIDVEDLEEGNSVHGTIIHITPTRGGPVIVGIELDPSHLPI